MTRPPSIPTTKLRTHEDVRAFLDAASPLLLRDALVAELSRRLLDSGHDYCFLYTDLANPTSNRTHQRSATSASATPPNTSSTSRLDRKKPTGV
jgi:hypothetical protein